MCKGRLKWKTLIILCCLVLAGCDNDNTILIPDFNPVETQLKTYKLPNTGAVAEQYLDAGMPFFYEMQVYGNLDENDVPIVRYEFGDYRNPVTTAQNAIAFHQKFLQTGNDGDKQSFLNNADWLCDNLADDNFLHYEFDFQHWVELDTFPAGWVSGMAQGEALAVLSVAYFLSNDERYLEAADRIFSTLHTTGGEYWCFYIDEEDYYWLEEYPSDDLCHVLNGFLFGLWGLWDYYVVSGNTESLSLFQAGIRTIADHYHLYRMGENRSMYCFHRIYSDTYHEMHLEQLDGYTRWFDIPEFRVAKLWLSH